VQELRESNGGSPSEQVASEYSISVRGIRKSYGAGTAQTVVLKGVDFDVRRGECVFLAGPSGSGKSTLLSILGCILSADAGQLQILGQDVTRFDTRQQAHFRRHRIGFVFQRFHLFRGMRAWENVCVAFELLGHRRRDAKSHSVRLLQAVGLGDKVHSHITQLSMGQRQRVALARALAGDPELILADEPTASLDATSGLNAMRQLRRLADEQQKTLVVVTHDSRIFPFADRILHLENGQIAQVAEVGKEPLPSESASTLQA
jgi:putative ABC transport system ATP-binding protein